MTYGNLINRIMESPNQPVAKVGDACTICMWSDRHPGTIVKVTATQIHVQEDNYKITSGSEYDGSAQYEYTPNPAARVRIFRKTKRRGYRNNGDGLAIGHRERYYDPSF